MTITEQQAKIEALEAKVKSTFASLMQTFKDLRRIQRLDKYNSWARFIGITSAVVVLFRCYQGDFQCALLGIAAQVAALGAAVSIRHELDVIRHRHNLNQYNQKPQ